MPERVIDIGEVSLAVLEEGRPGDRPLLLMHGFTGAKEDFGDEIERLAALGHHVVAPDHRGHGASSKPDSVDGYSLEILAADMWGLVDALGWERLDLLGHSMGGMVAQIMALAQPGRLTRLVLMDTHHGALVGLDGSLLELGVEIALTQGMGTILELLSMGSDQPLGTGADTRYRAAHPEYVEWCDRKFLSCSPHMYAALLPVFGSVGDRLDALGGLACPTLVVVGEEDEAFLDSSVRMAETITDARLEVIAGGGHSPQFEARDEWRRSIDAFLAAPLVEVEAVP